MYTSIQRLLGLRYPRYLNLCATSMESAGPSSQQVTYEENEPETMTADSIQQTSSAGNLARNFIQSVLPSNPSFSGLALITASIWEKRFAGQSVRTPAQLPSSPRGTMVTPDGRIGGPFLARLPAVTRNLAMEHPFSVLVYGDNFMDALIAQTTSQRGIHLNFYEPTVRRRMITGNEMGLSYDEFQRQGLKTLMIWTDDNIVQSKSARVAWTKVVEDLRKFFLSSGFGLINVEVANPDKMVEGLATPLAVYMGRMDRAEGKMRGRVKAFRQKIEAKQERLKMSVEEPHLEPRNYQAWSPLRLTESADDIDDND